MQDYKKLLVWKKSYELTKKVYRLTKSLPQEELFGLTSQIKRASISISSNISEGCSRKTKKDFARFLRISFGSLSELGQQMFLCRDLYKIDISQVESELIEISKMLTVLIKRVEE